MPESNYPLMKYYDRIHRRYDLVNRLFTLGMDQSWRKATARLCLKDRPARIIDLCCGTGDLALMLHKKDADHPEITAYDFSHEMLEIARAKAARKKLTNIRFIHGDAASMPLPDNSFDALTIGFGFRNLIYRNDRSGAYLSEMTRILKKGSKLFILESAVPSTLIMRLLYRLYLLLVLIPLGGLITGHWKAYHYLARSSAGFYSAAELKSIMQPYGLHIIEKRAFFFGAAQLLVVRRD